MSRLRILGRLSSNMEQVQHPHRHAQQKAEDHKNPRETQLRIQPISRNPGNDHLKGNYHDPRRPLIGQGESGAVVDGTFGRGVGHAGHVMGAARRRSSSPASFRRFNRRLPGSVRAQGLRTRRQTLEVRSIYPKQFPGSTKGGREFVFFFTKSILRRKLLFNRGLRRGCSGGNT